MLVDWNIQHRSRVCQICSIEFKDKETYHTALFEEPDQYERWDVCNTCWKTRRDEIMGENRQMVSHWKGVFEAPTPPPPEAIQKENAESLLRKLIELDDPSYINAQFILAVMLERKRILKIKAEPRKNGVRWLMYERAKTGELFPVQDPNLHLDALEQVQEQVAELFEKGLPTNAHQLSSHQLQLPQEEEEEDPDLPTTQIEAPQSDQEEDHTPGLTLTDEHEATAQGHPESEPDLDESTGKFD